MRHKISKRTQAKSVLETIGIIRAISFDITGTLVRHRESISETYARCGQGILSHPPSREAMRPAFRRAYREACEDQPYFGYYSSIRGNEREWWKYVVRLSLKYSTNGTSIDDEEFERYFRRVYQHYGSPEGYTVLPEVISSLEVLRAQKPAIALGVTSNTPHRTIDTTLPMLNLSGFFNFFVCTADIGAEKPEPKIFEKTLHEVRTSLNDFSVQPHEILHIGDSLVTDYCGARAAGFSALFLNRVDGTTTFQDWLVAPDYPGKSDDDLAEHTIKDLSQVSDLFLSFSNESLSPE